MHRQSSSSRPSRKGGFSMVPRRTPVPVIEAIRAQEAQTHSSAPPRPRRVDVTEKELSRFGALSRTARVYLFLFMGGKTKAGRPKAAKPKSSHCFWRRQLERRKCLLINDHCVFCGPFRSFSLDRSSDGVRVCGFWVATLNPPNAFWLMASVLIGARSLSVSHAR